MSKKRGFRLYLVLAIVALTSTAVLALDYNISANDNNEEYVADGGMSTGSSDLEMPYEDAGNPPSSEQIIGVRWVVPLAPGAKILKAYIEFTVDENKGGTLPVNLIIEGQLALNAPGFADVAKNISSRSPWTKAQVQWAAENWPTVGLKSRTADISPIIQEIIDQPGWAAGNALVIAIRDDKSKPSTGVRCASTGPVLHLEVFNPTAYAPLPADGEIGVAMPLLKWTKGDEAISHNVYLGTTPDLTEADRVATKLSLPLYYHTKGLTPGAQYYWRVDEVGLTGQVIQGRVWSFVMQAMTAYHPSPTDGSADASPTATLTWQPGQSAMKHHLYLGTSLDAVTQGAASTDKGELTAATFTPAAALDSVTTYYWRVDELGLGGAVKTGPVWSFTTHLPVDDFERYTDKPGEEIFTTWIDGFTDGTNGSTVGHMTAINGTFGETAIVHSGKQSMPMDYNNVKAPYYSETYQEFSPTQNWTANELADLRLEFRGLGSNGAGALYVVVEDSSNKSAVVTNADPAAVTAATWTSWEIPLSSLTGVNLAKVKRLYLGVGDRKNPAAGGAGRVYIDDIRVTKP
jgi:hypothetical protein